jgi:[protein-PII] uridylyltransferase
MLSPADTAPSGATDLIDAPALAAELQALAEQYVGRDREMRTAIAQHLKAALTKGRTRAEELLLADRRGRRCAERLCHMQDEIIRVLFELAEQKLYPAQNPSEAERMAVIATGGYGRGILAPGSDIDLLFLLPYKQTAWSESIAEAILYCLWDMGLKVGHATRSIDECIRQSKADMTIRTSVLEARFLLGDRKLFDDLMARFDHDVVRGTAREFVAAKLAEREERHRRAGQSRYLVEPNIKDGSQIRLPGEGTRGADRARRLRPARISALPPLRRFSLGGALPHAFRHRPRRGASFLRHPARDRGPPRLHRASGAA